MSGAMDVRECGCVGCSPPFPLLLPVAVVLSTSSSTVKSVTGAAATNGGHTQVTSALLTTVGEEQGVESTRTVTLELGMPRLVPVKGREREGERRAQGASTDTHP